MKEILVVGEKEVVTVQNDLDYLRISEFPGFMTNPNLYVTTRDHKILKLTRVFHDTDLNLDRSKERLPDWTKETGTLTPFTDSAFGTYGYQWHLNCCITYEPLAEHLQYLERQKKGNEAEIIALQKRVNKMQQEVNEFEQHPIKNMFKQIIKNIKGA